jgi:hypothetical protein
LKTISTHNFEFFSKSTSISPQNKYHFSEKVSFTHRLPTIFHPYTRAPRYIPNNILGNFKLEMQQNNCQFEVCLANTLHSGQPFDLSFHGNNAVEAAISEFGKCVKRSHNYRV